MSTYQAERNKRIAKLVTERKLTFAEIGRQYGISRERARQIALDEGATWPRMHLAHVDEDKIQRCYTLIMRGMPIAHAAQEEGLTGPTLRSQLLRRGLHTPVYNERPWNDFEETFLKDHYKQPGWTASEIGFRLDRTRNEIIGKANRMGLTSSTYWPKLKEQTNRRRLRSLRLKRRGYSHYQIAQDLGCQVFSVSGYLARARKMVGATR